MNELQFNTYMTTKEVAKALNVSVELVTKRTKELFPNKMQKGQITVFNQAEVTLLKKRIQENTSLATSYDRTKLPNVKTELDYHLMQKELNEWNERKINELITENNRMKPKEVEYDKFMSSNESQSVGAVAKILKIGRNTLFKILREKKILMANNIPYQEYMQYFEVIEKPIDKGNKVVNTPITLIKPKGVEFLSKRIID